MSFAKGEDVMKLVESLIHEVYEYMRRFWQTRQVNGVLFPSFKPDGMADAEEYPDIEATFPRITYHEAMSLHGSDKPDLRIPNKVRIAIMMCSKGTADNNQDPTDRPHTAPELHIHDIRP